MKTITTTLNKLFIAMLSFVTMFVCAFTFPMHKDSAWAETENKISDESIAAFVEAALGDLVLTPGGAPICFLVDRQVFTEAETSFAITQTTILSDLNDSAFMQALARDFAEKLGITIIDIGSPIDVTTIFDLINLNIIINIGGRQYINVITGVYSSAISNYSSLCGWHDYVTDTTSIYGMIVFEHTAQFYNLLVDVQRNHTGNMRAYALDHDGMGNSGGLNVTIL
jgi:hypothetical protein